MVFYAFDLLFLGGEALWKRPLDERRLALGRIVPRRSAILLSEDHSGLGADLFRIACEHELEGIVSKRLDRAYQSGRSRDWLKTKCVQSEAFVIIGYQPGSGAVRTPLANIKIAIFDSEGCGTPARSARALVWRSAWLDGNVVKTASGVATVTWVGRRRLDVTAHPRPAEIMPIRIAAHAFADNVPARDLFVSPGHGIAVNGALIPAGLLVNGTTIAQVEVARVEYWHVELARHDLVYAEGLASESYIDCGNRAAFEDQGGALTLHPSFAPSIAAYASMEDACLPWVVAGPALDNARVRLARRAKAASGEGMRRLISRALRRG